MPEPSSLCLIYFLCVSNAYLFCITFVAKFSIKILEVNFYSVTKAPV